MLNPDDIGAKLGRLKEITYLFFGAYIERPTAAEKKEVNVRLLRNLICIGSGVLRLSWLKPPRSGIGHLDMDKGRQQTAEQAAVDGVQFEITEPS